MWCPFCNHDDTRVVDSRVTVMACKSGVDGNVPIVPSRFNTYETPELIAPRVIKAGGIREAFSEDKLRKGMLKALEKRPVETRKVERPSVACYGKFAVLRKPKYPVAWLVNG